MRLCSGSGCGRAVPDDTRFCTECLSERGGVTPLADVTKQHTVSDRERYAFLYSGARWQRVRNMAIKRCPLCSHCERRISEIVDHRVPAGIAIAQAQASGKWVFDKWAGFYLMSNLHGLCRACHAVKTDEDKAHVGPWPSVVEREATAAKKVWAF